MSYETADQMLIFGETVYPLALEECCSVIRHLVNPVILSVYQQSFALCSNRPLWYLEAISRTPTPICKRCVMAAREGRLFNE